MRIEQHKAVAPVNAVEKSRKLKSLQVTQSKLISVIRTNRKIIHQAENDIKAADKQLIVVEKEIDELSIDSDELIITEHAYLRYLERVEGIDLQEVHKKILALAEKDRVMQGNTVVTVVTDPEDHFNLAGRERL